MKKLYYLVIFLVFNPVFSKAQEKAPHISGNVSISIERGSIQCDFKLSNLPALGKQYKLLLNRGFNINLLKNDSGRVLSYVGYYGGRLKGEAMAYLPQNNDDTLKLPPVLQISYVGAFPIYKDTPNAFDFKGFIAFNGKTLRAAEQTKWYPVIYDEKSDRELLDVTYDITFDCKDCKSIYLNGSQAQPGPIARFKSAKPRQLLLFAGNYAIQALSSSTFLNAAMNDDEARVFNQNITFITNFYNQYLNSPYLEKITFLQHQSVRPYVPKSSWGFVTFPTIAVSGQGFKTNVNVQSGLFSDTSTYQFYAHELGHYYFGQLLQPNSTLKWFFLESMAEFLAIKAAEAKYGKVATTQLIAAQKPRLQKSQITPLSQISNFERLGESYRYEYAPLILLAMEKRFGEEKVKLFCRQLLKNNGQQTDYPFFVNTIKQSGIRDADWKLFEQQVIIQRDCKNVFNYL